MGQHFRKSTRAFSGVFALTDEEIEDLHDHYNSAGEGYQEGLPRQEWESVHIEPYTEPKFEDV